MKYILFIILLFTTTTFAQKDYIVVFKEPTDTSYLTNKKIKVKKKFTKALNGYVAELNDVDIKQLKSDGKVEYIEPDQLLYLQNIPWGVDRLDQPFLPLNSTYNYTYTGQGVDAYIMDTGINTNHSEFEGRASVAVDFINDGNLDCNGHGTHVAGTVGGKTFGVAKNVNLKALRVFNCGGSGTISSMIAGIDWVLLNKTNPSVINISLVVSTVSNSLNLAVNNSVRQGVPVVVAAANYGLSACNFSPGSAELAITVAATDITDTFATYSNRGPCVDINAPGTGIESAAHWDNTSSRVMSGTSMSSPHVTGIVALYLEHNPTATGLEVHNTVKYAGTPDVVINTPELTTRTMAYSAFLNGCSTAVYYNSPITEDVFTITNNNSIIGTVSPTHVLFLEKAQGRKWMTVISGNNIFYSAKSGIYRWRITGEGIYRACLSR